MIKYANSLTLPHAAATGDVASVRRLLSAGAAIDDLDNAPLRRALQHGQDQIVRLLVDAGADMTDNMEEFLKLAAKNRHSRCLKILLSSFKGAMPPLVLNETLYGAIAAGNAGGVALLIAAGADPRAQDDQPSMIASTTGSVKILRILRRQGADFNAKDGQALFNAVIGNHLVAAKYIIDSGAYVQARDGIAITLAMMSGNAEILEALLDAGGKLQHPFLIVDSADSDSLETLMLLIRRGNEFHAYAEDVAMNAVRHNALRVLNYVLKNSTVSPHALAMQLQVAVDKAGEKVLDLLLKHGADATANASNALMRAVKLKKVHFARKLIDAGAQARDLDASSFVASIKAKNWLFLTELLQRSLPVTGVLLSPEEAATFFRQISPQAFIHDANGQLLPVGVCMERHVFARTNGAAASKKSGNEAIFICGWITQFLIVRGGHS